MDITLPAQTTDIVTRAQFPTGYHALENGTAVDIDTERARIRMRADDALVEVTALTPTIFRVGYFPHGRTIDYHSVAVVDKERAVASVSIAKSDDAITLETATASAQVTLNPLRIGFTDRSGRVFATDDPELGMGWLTPSAQLTAIDIPNALGVLGTPVRVYKQHVAGEHYFGCGERIGGLDKTESYQLFWNIDPPPGRTALQNNLYVSIPFTFVLADGMAWGFFLDSLTMTEFDLAREDSQRSSFSAACGDLIYYVFCGPTPQDVLAQYTELTGRTPLPPQWGLGNGQSRFSYASAEEVLRIARTFRERDIPCDTIYLDIDYMDGFRNFTWNSECFPDPAHLLTELQELGFHVVSIVDAGVKVDENYAVYTEGRARALFSRTLKGYEYQNVVWPGVCAFPDFFNAETRQWWGEQHRALLALGITGIWCDMNEPAFFTPANSTMPADVLHMQDGKTRLHLQVHNAYGSLMVQSTREGLLHLRPEQRPFIITRSAYAGVQRNSIVWTGDNLSTWDNLAMSVAQLLNLGLSGVGWCGVDIGGYYEDANGELVARWTEFGIFQAFCRNHAEKQARAQEPWIFGEPYESVCRKMLTLRQRLLPYLYTLFDECHRSGAPVLRPLFWTSPADTTTYSISDEFLCGDALLVAPITRPGIEYRHVYVPQGIWFHYWTGERIEGPAHILAHAPLGEPALYVRANTILPLYPAMNYVHERSAEPLTLMLYPASGRGEAILYEDEGDGYAQEQGVYARRTLTCVVNEDLITVSLGEQEGTFVPARQRIVLEVHGIATMPVAVATDGDWHFDEAQRCVIVECSASTHVQTITITTSTALA
jgi:Alpha-glucosidases, family 31 of glycosyl hydrolases